MRAWQFTDTHEPHVPTEVEEPIGQLGRLVARIAD